MANENDREKYVGISGIINIYKYIEMFVYWLLSYSFFNVVAVLFLNSNLLYCFSSSFTIYASYGIRYVAMS